jgi:GNAT superfamily N-acetyltransferase
VPTIDFRTALAADADFVFRVVETTMRDYNEKQWGAFDVEGNKRVIGERIAAGTFEVIRFEGADIGVLRVERHDGHIQLDQLFILPSHQNRGIGARIVRELVREAREAGKPLRLRVLEVNPARKFYEREGFRVIATTPGRIHMELID